MKHNFKLLFKKLFKWCKNTFEGYEKRVIHDILVSKESNWIEKTDPVKFIFEDIAIASKLQTFVDLGCGNGLLTYILTSEGYDGIGIDLRKRKIWDLFISKGAKLHVQTLQPNIITFPNHDWIIGNHADELDSNNFCKIIKKFKIYAYQEYIKEIIEQCGFTLEYDWLRIPSTKNYAMCWLYIN
ncbi:9012_t:CDS:2 [Entrophospora sp. SA101]|nr:9012_t:CDS:2 [Entrophospora sp. SA101]